MRNVRPLLRGCQGGQTHLRFDATTLGDDAAALVVRQASTEPKHAYRRASPAAFPGGPCPQVPDGLAAAGPAPVRRSRCWTGEGGPWGRSAPVTAATPIPLERTHRGSTGRCDGVAPS